MRKGREGDYLTGCAHHTSSQAAPVWVLTDGKIGDDVQCLAVAEALGEPFDKRVIAPRPPWEWAAPWGPIDPKDKPASPSSPIAPPYPDLVICSGRRAIPYAHYVKRAAGGKPFILVMKNPRFALSRADMIWAPKHDKIEVPNIFSTLTSPHNIAAKITTAQPHPKITVLARPMLGVILGGPSGGARYDRETATQFASNLLVARSSFASLAITPSRRTPVGFLEQLRDALRGPETFIWDRTGNNPYFDILANSSSIIVAADSHNMMSEAVSTGVGVYAWRPPSMAAKLDWFVNQLEKEGAVRPFYDSIEKFDSTPIDATNDIVVEIKRRLKLNKK